LSPKRISSVDDRHDAQAEQPVERCRGIQITPPVLQIVERHQDLRRGQPFGRQHLGPHLRQCNLAGCGRRLRVFQSSSSTLGKPEPPRAECNGARRHDGDLLARTRAFGDVGGDPDEPVTAHRPVGIDEQRRPDLDDQPETGGRREQHDAADSARRCPRQCYYVSGRRRRYS
jgi:hypothetical protein